MQVNNSIICLTEENTKYKAPPYMKNYDPFQHADIGWVDQMLPLIETYTTPFQNVLDIFAGLGSTSIAAKVLNRHAFMIEIEPLRCKLIQERWSTFDITSDSELVILNNDSLYILKNTDQFPPIHLAVTNTPYFSTSTPLSNQSQNLYNNHGYESYLIHIEQCLIELRKHLSGGGVCIMTCQNIRNTRGELFPIAWDIAKLMQNHYIMFDEKIFYYPNNHRNIEHPLHTHRQHEYVLIAKKYLTSDQCLILKELIFKCQQLSLNFKVFGSFKNYLNNNENFHHIGDLDLKIPKDIDNLRSLLLSLTDHHSFKIWSWNDPLDLLNFNEWNFHQIFDRYYLRLILSVPQDTIQIDLMFQD